MEQPLSEWESRQNATRKQRNREEKKSYASNKPWWLVIFIVVLLAGFLFYIKWLNSPESGEYHSFWAYLVEPSSDEVQSGSRALPADDMAVLFGTDVDPNTDSNTNSGDDWTGTSSPAIDSPKNDGFAENSGVTLADKAVPLPPAPSPKPQVTNSTSVPTQGAVYVINAGEFKTKGSAQFRVSELRQGNYAARIIEPSSADGMYEVVVGEYQKESSAKSVAQSMSFILEIRASVEEKR